MCWVTQLVVHRAYRERGLATGLLNELRQEDDSIYGIMSSHPAACVAAIKAFGGKRTLHVYTMSLIIKIIGIMNSAKLEFIREHAQEIMAASPISYVKDARSCGRLFNPDDLGDIVSCVDTRFFIDHTEPLKALTWVKESMDWHLGELNNGHEFLLILEARRHTRSRFCSSSAASRFGTWA